MLWCIGGDFNLVKFPRERDGHWGSSMDKFGEFIERWNLIDGPFKGARFTWSNF